jgi:hypothetical protein
MENQPNLKPEEIAVRAHDITVCLERTSVPEFDLLTTLGKAVRLALHLRGVPAVSYSLIKDVAIYLLDFNADAVRPVLELLADAEFVRLDTEGRTIKTVIPDVPFYSKLFSDLGDIAKSNNLSEPEWLTLLLLHRLAGSPLLLDQIYQIGAEKRLVNRIIDIGSEGSFLINRRARGRSILISPTYFPENSNAYADLVAASGANRVKKVLDLLKMNQGWPLSKLLAERELCGVHLDDDDLAVVKMLAGEGFIPPPAIKTTHAGMNYFLFGPRPGITRLPSSKRPIYEAAMALVAAVRQGQLLPAQYAIHSPYALLRSLKEKKFLRANTEAIEQYRKVASLRVGKLERVGSGSEWARFVLIDRPENIEAVDMAIEMVLGSEPPVMSSEEIIISLRKGEKYVESLIGRKRILADKVINIDEESQAVVESFLLRGRE